MGTKEALDRVEAKYRDIDVWLANELRYETPEEMCKVLSPEQVDAVAVSIYNAELDNGTICADQTGLGKGRVGAALARWAAINDRPFVFLTVKSNLFTDFWRDIVDINAQDIVGKPYIMNNGVKIIDPVSGDVLFSSLKTAENKAVIESGKMPEGCNMVFTTYSQLNRKGSDKSAFFAEVCKGAHIHADECHNAAGSDSNTHTSVAKAMDEAKSYSFSSATFEKNATNLAIYKPLMPNSFNNVEVLEKGGMPFLEALSKAWAQRCNTTRREHDQSEMVIQLKIDKENSQKHEEYSDILAPVLSDLMILSKDVNKLIEKKNNNKAESQGGIFYTVPFGTRASAVERQFLAACKVDMCIDLCVKLLKEGTKPSFTIEHTMESLLRDLLAENGSDLDDDAQALLRKPDLEFKDVLHILVDRMLKIKYKKGKEAAVEVEIDDKQIVNEAERIRKALDRFPRLPLSPMDAIMDGIKAKGEELFEAGEIDKPWVVDEISARSLRVGKDGIEGFKPVDRNQVISQFQNGSIDCLALTKAASTGLSLHANAKAADKRPRALIEFQTMLNPTDRIQFWGRILRRGVIGPVSFYCLATDLPMELRGLARHNKKVAELSVVCNG